VTALAAVTRPLYDVCFDPDNRADGDGSEECTDGDTATRHRAAEGGAEEAADAVEDSAPQIA
jgi:hypothetical protein